jgi:putative tryptophan/tyrosine transport system substrate-binding protein
LAGKRLELLKETIPKLSRVAVLWNPQNEGSTQVWKESQAQAKELGLQLHSMAVNSADQLESGFKEAVKARSGALVVTAGALLTTNQKQIISLAAKYRLADISGGGEFVANGGLMSYGPDRIEPYQRGAVMVDKILKGAKPADLPIEQPTKFELMINLKTAKTLGLTIPAVVLMRAGKVIKESAGIKPAWHVGNSMRENREALQTPTLDGVGRSKKAKGRNVDMYVCG